MAANALNFIAGHVFSGIVSLRFNAHADAHEFVEELNDAGVRFSFFSRGREMRAVAMGGVLGVETDWNCCISLRQRDALTPSRLPHGIAAIRDHITHADDVPLRVPMFCDAREASIVDMIDVYRDNGHIVAVVGSAMAPQSVAAFGAADVAVAVAPQRTPLCLVRGGARESPSLSSVPVKLNSLSCAVRLGDNDTFGIVNPPLLG